MADEGVVAVSMGRMVLGIHPEVSPFSPPNHPSRSGGHPFARGLPWCLAVTHGRRRPCHGGGVVARGERAVGHAVLGVDLLAMADEVQVVRHVGVLVGVGRRSGDDGAGFGGGLDDGPEGIFVDRSDRDE